MVGNGFVEAGRPETGLKYCDTALKAGVFRGRSRVSVSCLSGKSRALIALKRNDEAQEVLDEALRRARTEERNYLALSQLLVVAGTAAASHDRTKAIRYLVEATNVSQK